MTQKRPSLKAPKRATKPLVKKRGKAKSAGTGRIRRGMLGLLLLPFRILWGFMWRSALLVTALVGLGVLYFSSQLPPAIDLVDGRAKGSVTLLDRDGQVFAWRGDQFGGIVTAQGVSSSLRNAVVATEDKRFYRHFGLSPRGIASAIRINLRNGRGPLSGNGGSTITQQTAKLLCLGVPFDSEVWESERKYERDCRRTTLWRKIKEATFAMAMEARYSKDEILTIYLNRAFLGAGARGFEAASQRYFGLSATQVDVRQSAMLAGLLKAPSRLAPTRNLTAAQNRAQVVIQLMEEQGYITKGEAEFAAVKPAELSPAAAAKAGGYFADWVMSSGPEYFTRNTTEDVIIRTTLDPGIQKIAENGLAHVFETKVSEESKAQAAVVVMSADGAVRAMVGGRDTQVAGAFNRAIHAKRQTGSTFKPFVFATALELGYGPNDKIRDEEITINIPGSGPWRPTNYTNDFKGNVTLTRALAQSINIPAVKLSEAVGRDLVRKVATDFGIQSKLADGPALALGASESTLLEMTGAYAGFLNGGSSVTPYGLSELRFQGDSEALIGQGGGIGERVISEASARTLTRMMFEVIENGTGRRARIQGVQVAGKTGTTQASRDAWFIGFTSDYVVGVWMGNDDNKPLRQVTGGSLPADIWREVMSGIVAQHQPGPLPMDTIAARNPAPQVVQAPVPVPTENPSEPNGLEGLILDTLSNILGGN
ncbi:MAG: transglycosylase domain-containing protein [Planktomarina sp.]